MSGVMVDVDVGVDECGWRMAVGFVGSKGALRGGGQRTVDGGTGTWTH